MIRASLFAIAFTLLATAASAQTATRSVDPIVNALDQSDTAAMKLFPVLAKLDKDLTTLPRLPKAGTNPSVKSVRAYLNWIKAYAQPIQLINTMSESLNTAASLANAHMKRTGSLSKHDGRIRKTMAINKKRHATMRAVSKRARVVFLPLQVSVCGAKGTDELSRALASNCESVKALMKTLRYFSTIGE